MHAASVENGGGQVANQVQSPMLQAHISTFPLRQLGMEFHRLCGYYAVHFTLLFKVEEEGELNAHGNFKKSLPVARRERTMAAAAHSISQIREIEHMEMMMFPPSCRREIKGEQ